jgi:hypothetical protein
MKGKKRLWLLEKPHRHSFLAVPVCVLEGPPEASVIYSHNLSTENTHQMRN